MRDLRGVAEASRSHCDPRGGHHDPTVSSYRCRTAGGMINFAHIARHELGF